MADVTVVIPNYNGAGRLKNCLDALLKQTLKELKLLVVDNGSTDGSLALLKESYGQVRVLSLDRNYGFCVAVNRGIQASDTPYVILLNNDTQPEPEFARALLEGIRASEHIFSCQAKMLDYNKRHLVDDAGDFYCALGWAFARGKGREEARYNKRERIFASCAGAAIYRRELFEKIGYFDEKHFAYLEDMDIGYRANIYGYTNYFEPGARVYHMGSATTGSLHNEFKVRLSARNSLYVAYKNMPLWQLLLNGPLLLLGILVKFVFFSKKHLGKEFLKGISEGFRLCKKENKVKHYWEYLGNYGKIQLELWKNVGKRLRKF